MSSCSTQSRLLSSMAEYLIYVVRSDCMLNLTPMKLRTNSGHFWRFQGADEAVVRLENNCAITWSLWISPKCWEFEQYSLFQSYLSCSHSEKHLSEEFLQWVSIWALFLHSLMLDFGYEYMFREVMPQSEHIAWLGYRKPNKHPFSLKTMLYPSGNLPAWILSGTGGLESNQL